MSRISGYFGGGSTAQARLFAEGMARLRAPSKPVVSSGPRGAMAVAATAVSAIAQKDACVAVVDGVFYNAAEFSDDASRGPAEQLVSLYRRFGFVEGLKRINGDFAATLFDE